MKPFYAIFALIVVGMIAWTSISIYRWMSHDSTTATVTSVPATVRYIDPTGSETTEIVDISKPTDIQKSFSFTATKDSTWAIEGIIWSVTPPSKVAITKLTFTGRLEAIREPSGEVRLIPVTPNLRVDPQPLLPKVAKVRWINGLVGIGALYQPADGSYAPMVWGGLQIKKVYLGGFMIPQGYGIQIGVKI